MRIGDIGGPYSGLLDSGAGNTILSGRGWNRLKCLNLPLNRSAIVECKVANGQSCQSIGTLEIPFQLENRVEIIKTLVIPETNHELILGADFWQTMCIVPDLWYGSWKFYALDSVNVDTIALKSESELTSERRQQLHQLIEQCFREMSDKLGCTTLVEHEIKTTAKPM